MIEIKPAEQVPGRKTGRIPCYPFADMKIGGMFEVIVAANLSPMKTAAKVRSAASAWRQRHGAACSFVIRHCDHAGRPLLNDQGRIVVRVWCEPPVGRGGAPKKSEFFK